MVHAPSGLDVQELMIMPVGADSFSEGSSALAQLSGVFHNGQRGLLKGRGLLPRRRWREDCPAPGRPDEEAD